MRFRTWTALIVSVVAAAFFVLNWSVFTTPVKLNLLLTSVETPVGMAMLVMFALTILVLSGYVGVWQGTLLMEFRRQAKELEVQRELAASAEASRFTELGALVKHEIASSGQRLETALEAMRGELRDTENSIAATLGEMDDRLQRAGRGTL